MKLFNKLYNEFILCPKCNGKEFIDIKPRNTGVSTFQIWCKKKDCNTDILVPVKAILKTKHIEIR